MNAISGIRDCLESLRASGIGQIVVVDANSTDGTREVALEIADLVLSDTGAGLGNARNIGIKETTGNLILNMGSDNVMPPAQLQKMINYLEKGGYHGVSAQTQIAGDNLVAQGLNIWRAGRFPEGERSVIGTPTLFRGEQLRSDSYNPQRKFSDDSELCERWAKKHGARFAISDAICLEIGKATWAEAKVRANMYGVSDHEVFSEGSAEGWGPKRKLQSIAHPLISDLITPLQRASPSQAARSAPFLAAFTGYRYLGWLKSSRS